MTRIYRLLCALPVVIWILLAGASISSAAPADTDALLPAPVVASLAKLGIAKAEEQTFPLKALRGYGAIAGRGYLFTSKGQRGSLLVIACENEAKAKLLQAKYLSDLTVLPGVQVAEQRVKGQALQVMQVRDQGIIAALRAGTRVTICAASDAALFAALAGAVLDPGLPPRSAAETTVPIYLDQWDRYSLRFYHRTWEAPPSDKGKNQYDPLEEIKWAEKIGHAGLIFWTGSAGSDLAVGMTDEPNWDWVLREATARKLPIGLNPCTLTGNSLPPWGGDQFQQRMPQCTANQYGIGEPYHSGAGPRLSWCADEGLDYALAPVQQVVRRHVDNPSVAFYMEPHCEVRHRSWDILLEYGPQADRSYRTFLREKYATPQAVAQRWHGNATALKSWDDVHVPEVASFQGWQADALDLAGQWRIAYEGTTPPGEEADAFKPLCKTSTAPREWADIDYDDADWAQITTPGADRWYLLPKQPVVLRRAFTVPEQWLATKPAWLYIWDLNQGNKQSTVAVFLNGRKIDELTGLSGISGHVGKYDVTDLLDAGDNQLTLRLPSGYLAYRVYLSHTPPQAYPGPDMLQNARWADFIDWYAWTRAEAVRRGIESIRAIDPNRPIQLAAPGVFAEVLRPLCETYGAHFYNTGYMSGFWAEDLPMMMRGVDMPFTLEPGGPANSVSSLKNALGLWATEGIQANNYFIHIGNIFYDDAQRNYFETQLPLVYLTGKYHAPKARAAELMSQRMEQLTGFPMDGNTNNSLGGGYWAFGHGRMPTDRWDMDALVPSDFEAGKAAPYQVVVDTNTSIMDPPLVAAIEKWVRNGGIFVTRIQTGRHSSVQADAWPISALTGYRVTRLDPLRPNGDGTVRRKLLLAPDQTVFPADAWSANALYGFGQTLERVAPECQDLLRWYDGGVAAGIRPLGKGAVINLGVGFDLPDIIAKILDWQRIPRVPGAILPAASAGGVMLRRYQSNNGLYDVWRVWNTRFEDAGPLDLRLGDLGMANGIDVLSGQPVALQPVAGGAGVKDLMLPPRQQQAYLVPRRTIERAALDWFTLQRGWWQGTTPPRRTAPMPVYNANTLDLTDGWAFMPVEKTAADVQPFIGTVANDADWERMRFGVWDFPNHHDVKHAILRKTFTVPAGWAKGTVYLWLQSVSGDPIVGRARMYLDGEPLKEMRNGGYELTAKLTAKSVHILALDITTDLALGGARGNIWLSFFPVPDRMIDLAGAWSASQNGLTYADEITLPGRWNGWTAARRTVRLPKEAAGQDIFLHYEGINSLVGVLVNGTYVRRHHHGLGGITRLNVTPWLRPGADNEIEIIGGGTGDLTAVALWCYAKPVKKD